MKYRAVPTWVGDIRFASKKEAARYSELLLLMRAGQISELTLQPKLHVKINNIKVFSYIPDFAYRENGQLIYEDVKGFKTPVYRLKKKIVEAHFGVQIRET